MGGDGFNNLTTALAVIFAISLLTLFAQLFYVFWRRRQPDTGDQIAQISSPKSKGLLYRLCVRLGRDSEAADSDPDGRDSGQQPEMEVIDIDLLKIQGMFGPPRFLFTIKEEEKEELESPAEKSLCSGKGGKARITDGDRVRLEEHLKIEVLGGGAKSDDATPFSTPCGSPVYFTPSASPLHDTVFSSSQV